MSQHRLIAAALKRPLCLTAKRASRQSSTSLRSRGFLATPASIYNHHSVHPLQTNLQAPVLCRFSSASSHLPSSSSSLPDSLTSLTHQEALLDARIKDKTVTHYDFLNLLQSLAASTNAPDAPRRAESLIKLWQETANRLNIQPPSINAYCLVIQAWAESRFEDPQIALVRAERWLHKDKPTTASLNAYLNACSKGRGRKSRGGDVLVYKNACKAQGILEGMMRDRHAEGEACASAPNIDSFSYVIRAWTRCRNNIEIANRAHHVLRLMQDYSVRVDPSVQANSRSFAMVMDAMAVCARLKIQKRLGDGMDEVEAIQALLDECRHSQHNQEQQSHQQQRQRHHQEPPHNQHCHHQKDTEVKVTTDMYNALLTCWAHISVMRLNGPLECERIFHHMQSIAQDNDDAAPDSYTYAAIIKAWINSKHDNRTERVMVWLTRQWQDYEAHDKNERLCPTVETYNTVIAAFVRDSQPVQAERVLAEMITKAQTCAETASLKPNSESYATVIRAWLSVARQSDVNALKQAVNIFLALAAEEKKETGLIAPVELYSTIPKVALRCAHKSTEVFDLSRRVYKAHCESHHFVDPAVYTSLVQISLVALSRPQYTSQRRDALTWIVKDASEAGLVTGPMLRTLLSGPLFYSGWTLEESKRMSHMLIPQRPVPPSWFRNVKHDTMLPGASDYERRSFTVYPHGVDCYDRPPDERRHKMRYGGGGAEQRQRR
jgi:pentatricopeptide repeat protein